MADTKYGVINEQGYVGGQFGFKPLNEQDNKAVNDEDDRNKKDDKKND